MTQEPERLPHGFRERLDELLSNLRQGVLYLRRLVVHKLTAGELFTDTISEQNDASGVTVDGVKLKDSQPYCDVINEKTAAAGVTIDGVKLKDSEPYCDVINEKTATAGVTIDGVLLKDSEVTTDVINEKTGAAGVTADGVLLKDGVVAIGDVAFDDATSDPLAVGDAAADGTENSVARKDHGHATGGTAGGELGGSYPNPTVDATHSGSAHHTQAHGIADHTGHANWKALYTDGSGDEQEIALGADGTVLTGTSATGAPAFEAASEHAHANDHPQVHGKADHTEHANWKLFHSDGSGDEQEIALGADGTVLTGTSTTGAPAFEAADEHAHTNDHAQAHTVASHSDTTATGAETETLTDGSDADALHDHGTHGVTHNAAHGISKHTEHANWKLFYSDASGDEQEIALGANGTVLTGTSATGAPAFEAADEHSHTNDHAQVHGPTDHTEGTAWRLVYQDASGDEQEIALGADGEVLTSTGAAAAPAFEALPAAGAHAILDGSTHSDSVADAVTRGSLIYGNATPKWDELVVGAANTVLASDSTDAGWTNTPTVELLYATAVSTDSIVEKTAAAGVTVDGLLIKDEYIEFDEIVAPGAGAANKLRLYALDQGAGVSALAFVNAAGTVTSLAARTRRVQMDTTAFPDGTTLRWPDGSTTNAQHTIRMPVDYVAGTSVTLNLMCWCGATGNVQLRSTIAAWSAGETWSAGNIESNVDLSANFTANVVQVLSRTFTPAAADGVQWQVLRVGGHASDTAAGNFDAFMGGAYLEYTAFF